MSDPVIEIAGVTKSYGGEVLTTALRGIDLRLERGEFVALTGPSGSGKSTLLNILGLLDRPSAGTVNVLGQPTVQLDDDALTGLRGRSLGFVFQFHHLLTGFSAVENVMMPMVSVAGRIEANMRASALKLLESVGVAELADRKPNQISGGQQQRVAVARALSLSPPLVLADEPTGNLDTKSAAEVIALIRRFNREMGITFLIATHDLSLAASCDRQINLVDGQIEFDRRGKP